ncbi:MAG: sigma-70 family RNA polymerase sigma factor, partial [Oscillibacter sp.]|nr:sigma-70 family RNA polymerase sigma factor [Oscillibacter sp.]
MTPVIRRCLAGDQQAQEALVLAAQNRVFYHCKKMLKHEEDALDATQEVLISMLTKLDKLQDPEAFWGWLSSMTANHCRNILNRGRREAQIPEDDEGNSLLDAFEDPDEQAVPDKALDNDETRRMIVALVDQLPNAQRQCVLMYYYEEMGVKDIANALETSEGTIKSRLNYARKAIKAGVDEYAAQGIQLYSALPFLVYFLQKDAVISGLSGSGAERLAQTVL